MGLTCSPCLGWVYFEFPSKVYSHFATTACRLIIPAPWEEVAAKGQSTERPWGGQAWGLEGRIGGGEQVARC